MDKGSPGEFGNLLVVLNVDGSSPSGHPRKKTSPKGNVFFCEKSQGFSIIIKSQGKKELLWDFFRIFAASSVKLVFFSKIWVVDV